MKYHFYNSTQINITEAFWENIMKTNTPKQEFIMFAQCNGIAGNETRAHRETVSYVIIRHTLNSLINSVTEKISLMGTKYLLYSIALRVPVL